MTRRLFHENPYIQSFSAAVVQRFEFNGHPALILDQTAFYPTSGGQPHDLGRLNNAAVVDVVEDDERRILHLLERPVTESKAQGQIDWKRRFDFMQQHTGQHLLSQVFLRLCDAETVSFHLGADACSIDLNQAELDPDAVEFVEVLANQILYENRAVITHLVSSDDLARFPIRKPPTVEGIARVVEIKDFDYSLCCGTHCAQTGEIGMIKITKAENYKGGSRIYFLCGSRALKDYQRKCALFKQLSEMMSSGEAELPQLVGKLQDELKTLRREQQELTAQALEQEANALLADIGAEVLAGAVEPGDGEKFGVQVLAEDARGLVAVHPGKSPAAQCAVDMDVADRDQFGARPDRGADHQVAAFGHDLLPGPHRFGDQPGGRRQRLRRLLGLGGGLRAGALDPLHRGVAARGQRDQPGVQRGGGLLGGAVLHRFEGLRAR